MMLELLPETWNLIVWVLSVLVIMAGLNAGAVAFAGMFRKVMIW